MGTKKGQGLSLNVIIIAALALIVLVVLVMVFTGRIGVFQQGLSKEGKAELVAFRVNYGDCKPTATAESNFDTEFSGATSVESKDQAKSKFNLEVNRCKALLDQNNCESSGCKWG